MPTEDTTNDAPQVSKLTSIPLGNLIGAPLLAIIQGQTQAAQATAEFIEQVGFEAGAGDGTMGKLRMVTFTYEKSKGKDQEEVHQVKIPLLSLVTIPNIRVKQVDLNYSVKVADIQSYESKTSLVSKSNSGSWLGKKRIELSSSVGSLDSSSQGSTNTNLQMNVDIRLKPAPIPGGLSFLYNTMEDALKQSQYTPEVIPLRPLDILAAEDVMVAYGNLKLTKNYNAPLMEVERNSHYRVIKDIKELYEAWVHGAAYLRKMYNQGGYNQNIALESRVLTYDRTNDPEDYGVEGQPGKFHEPKIRAWEGKHYPDVMESGLQYTNHMMMTSELLPLGEEGFDVYSVGGFLLDESADDEYLYYFENLTSLSRSKAMPDAPFPPTSAYAYYPDDAYSMVGKPLSAGKKIFVQTVRKNELTIYEKTSTLITPEVLVKDSSRPLALPTNTRLYTGCYISNNVYSNPLHGTLDALVVTKPLSPAQRNQLATELYKLYISENTNT